MLDVISDCFTGFPTNRDQPGFVAFAGYTQDPLFKVHVGELQRAKLCGSQPGSIKHLQNGAVTQRVWSAAKIKFTEATQHNVLITSAEPWVDEALADFPSFFFVGLSGGPNHIATVRNPIPAVPRGRPSPVLE